MAAIATVVNIKGDVFAVNAQGVKRQLHNGDKLQEGEVLVTAPGSTAELEMDGGKHFTVPEHQTFVIDASVASGAETPEAASAALAEGSGVAQKVIQALQSGDPNALIEAEATAAGLAGQGGGDEGGVSFVRLLRIAEGVSPVGFEFGINTHVVQDVLTPGAAIEETSPVTTTNEPPTIGVQIPPPDQTNGVPFGSAAEATVFEAGLPAGSAPGNGNIVSGNFQIADPDGLGDVQSVTINGQTIAIGSLVGSVITTPTGVLTITGYANGVASFSYELTTATTDVPNQAETDVFTLTVSDAQSTSAPATITITIVDDVPSINVADQEISPLTVDETVLATNDTANFSGVFASFFGADGAGSLTYGLSINGGNGTDSGLVDSASGQHVLLYMNGSNIEGRTATGGDVVFVISVDGSGNVTLDQQRAVMHDTGTQGDTSEPATIDSGLVVLTATVTDADGDTAGANIDLGAQISFLDDGPSISLADVSTPALAVDETDLSVNATTSFAGLFSGINYGADGAASSNALVYTLGVKSAGVDSGIIDTATGQHVLLTMNGNVVEGRTAISNVLVFTISVDGSGNVTLDQIRAVVQADKTNPDTSESVTLSSVDLVTLTATVTDKDGDSASQTASIGTSISFLDDGPTGIYAEAVNIDNLATATAVTANLNFIAGADGIGSVVFNVAGVTLGVTTGQTLAATDSDGHLLTVNGEQLYLYYGGVDGTDTTMLVARTADGSVTGFTIDIDPTTMTGTYTFSPDYIISNGTEVSATDLTGVGGGNVSFKLLINVGGTSQDVAMTTLSGDSINTNHTEIGISGGNSFSFGEGIRFDLVNGLTLIDNPNPAPDSFSYNGTHNLVSRWEESVTGMSPGEKANFTLSVFNANSDNVFYGDTNDTQINLDPANIRVYDASHNLVANNTQGLTITDSGDSVLVTGLQNGWSYEIVTDDAHQFSAVQLDAATGTDTFKLGFFDYGTTSAGTPIDLSYSIVGTDGDGDPVSGEINVSLYPDSMTITATDANPDVTGDSSDNILLGTSGNNDLGGAGGNDTLVSGAGSDTLSGGDGNDLLIGGSGNDMLTGGTGADTFKWVLGDALSTTVPVDHVTDFDPTNSSDKLDLRDLLQGETHVGTDPGNLANYLHFTSDGSNTAIQVKSHGATGVVDQVIVLDGVGDLTAGGANTDAAIITTLLNANKLIVD